MVAPARAWSRRTSPTTTYVAIAGVTQQADSTPDQGSVQDASDVQTDVGGDDGGGDGGGGDWV